VFVDDHWAGRWQKLNITAASGFIFCTAFIAGARGDFSNAYDMRGDLCGRGVEDEIDAYFNLLMIRTRSLIAHTPNWLAVERLAAEVPDKRTVRYKAAKVLAKQASADFSNPPAEKKLKQLAFQQRIRIDVVALPVFFRISNGPDRKMKVAIARARVTGVADITNDIAPARVITRSEIVGVTVEMRVIKDQFLVPTHLVDRVTAGFVPGKPDDLAVVGGQHRGPARGHNVNRAVAPASRTSRVESVAQFVWPHTLDRNDQID
jgi:hypothetical protein